MDLLKNLDNMITAEEFLNEKYYHIELDLNKTDSYINLRDIHNAMIEFAKLHVEAALKEASEKAFVEYIDLTNDEIFDYTDVITDDDVGVNVNKKSILNAYPLDLIK